MIPALPPLLVTFRADSQSHAACHRFGDGGYQPLPHCDKWRTPFRPNPHEVKMNNKLNALLLTAALSGLIGGTTVAAHAASTQGPSKVTSVKAVKAGLRYAGQDTTKHSCKGKNDCKGQGGCKAGDNGCKGKNSCKGKGGCATDGSKPPSFA
jgi:hypothetical protein